MDLRVIDNFLPPDNFKKIESLLLGDNFPWFYNNNVITSIKEIGIYQFTHTFFDVRDPWNGISSQWYGDCIDPFAAKLNVRQWVRAKGNLLPRTVFNRNTGYHVDIHRCTTAVYYVNTCNGYTKFKSGEKVKSVANRIVIFDSSTYHAGFTCTNSDVRVTLNLNYA